MTEVGALLATLARFQGALLVVGVVTAAVQQACGSTPPPDSPEQPIEGQNPCPSVTTLTSRESRSLSRGIDKRGGIIDSEGPWRVLDSIWNHRAATARGQLRPLVAQPLTADVGEIAVLQDEGDLFRAANLYDLRDASLRFTPNTAGGYDVERTGSAVYRSPLGTQLTLGDDDSALLSLPFPFPFYTATQSTAFVNSDGNITFGDGDSASTPRSVSRLLTGPPRVAPFLADLDPSDGGGIYTQDGAGAFTVTWCTVRGFGTQETTTVQASLLQNGVVEMTFDSSIVISNAIVGLSPGRTATFAAVDLTEDGSLPGGSAAVGERFSDQGELDTVAVARKFYQTHLDQYDQLVIWADTRRIFDAFAFEITVANDIRGIGQDLYDSSLEYGSAELGSLVVMDSLGKYPDDPFEQVLGEYTTLGVLGQEVGHRWLAFMRFSDHNRQTSRALLGRGQAHWGFFFDSDASVMEGNDIEDLGGGSFRTVAAAERYSRLDQYAMGLRQDFEVPPFFYVDQPMNVVPSAGTSGPPQVGVTFNGTRRDVLIQDIIEVEGPRQPSADQSPRILRQAFIYLVGEGRTADPAEVARLDRIRVAWEAFFSEATEGRMRAETRLRAPTVSDFHLRRAP